ncbi:MAG: hypothetical protein P9X24_10230 [Candidatus Hatepunaea meridiana]|nr:hypothetical protein [Candidatus Hatepunaea meridiana]
MGLKERLGRIGINDQDIIKRKLFKAFGFIANPFPPAGQPFGHPHLEDEADEKIATFISSFEFNNTSHALLIEGRQGVGKTNLLNYYESELKDLYLEDEGFYIIRYLPDPEPSFDKIIRFIFNALGKNHISKLGQELATKNDQELEGMIARVRSYDVKNVLINLRKSFQDDENNSYIIDDTLEWLVGLRLLNRHRYSLGVQFRLDTVESKTQALRDIVECSVELGILKGIFLLLDELEKQDSSLSHISVLRYLSAIRAIIDALPNNFFLMAALTVEAKRRYFGMLPAFAGRMQNSVVLKPLQDDSEAMDIYSFYLFVARKKAKKEMRNSVGALYQTEFLPVIEIKDIFDLLLKESSDRGIEGVTQRDFLNKVHLYTEEKIQTLF